jgi:hypothetical protein
LPEVYPARKRTYH